MDLPSISRLNETGIDKLYTDEHFTSSLNGELSAINLSSNSFGEYGAKIEQGNSLIYDYDSSGYWTATDKAGTIYTFGNSTDTRQDNPDDSTQVFQWMLEEIRDTNDNYIKYEYSKDSGAIYPETITYTGNGTTDGIFTVEFTLESRDDTSLSYATGFAIETNSRVSDITVSIDGSSLYEYAINYTTGDNGVRSLLSSFTQTIHNDDGSQFDLPSNEFTYETSLKTWTADENYSIPVDFMYVSGNENYKGVEIMDINGDGLSDLIHSTYISTTNNTKTVYLNNGDNTGWTEDTAYSIPDHFWDYTGERMKNFRGADVNADGLVDLIEAYTTSGPSYQSIYLNNGDETGWYEDTDYTLPVYFNQTNEDQGIRMFDINGDGLIDFTKAYLSSAGVLTEGVYINNWDGTGWTEDTNYSLPVYFFSPGNDNFKGVDIGDVNGDGFVDLIESYSHGTNSYQNVYLNNGDGTGWSQDVDYTIPVYFHRDDILGDKGIRLFDANGDGMMDFVESEGKYSQYNVYLNDSNKADILNSINHSSGATTSMDYSSSTSYDNPNLPFNIQVLSSITSEDGLGDSSSITYEYSDGEYYYVDEYDRRFAGFATISKTESDRESITYYNQGDTDGSLIGKVDKTETYDSAGNLYQRKVYTWENTDLGDDNDFVYLSQDLTMTYDGDNSHKDNASAYTYDSTTGNLTTSTQYGEVTGSEDGSFTDISGNEATTISTLDYAIDANDLIRNKVSTQTLSDDSGSTLAESKYYYDSLSHGSVDTGNLSKDAKWLDTDNSWLETEYTVNSYGLVTDVTNPRGSTLSTTYDLENLYPATVSNELGHSISYEYEYGTGQVTSQTNANGYTSEMTYDGLGRALTVSVPDPSTGTTSLLTSTSYTDSSFPNYSTNTTTVDGIDMETRNYLDGFGRVFQQWIPTENATPTITNTWYDELGQIEYQSLPYTSSSASYTGRDSSQERTQFTYDPLGRVLTETAPVGTTSSSYDDWEQTTIDPNGINKTYYYDAYTRLIQVDEENTGSTYETNYNYDELNNLTKITDAQGNERNFTYDSLSRKASQEDLHDTVGTYGTWEYTYDENGNILTQTDPSAQVIAWTYDELDRITGEDWEDSGSDEITYVFDTASNGIGLISNISGSDFDFSYSYDAQGNLNTEVKTINANDYTTETSYDLLSRVSEVIYPDSALTVNTTYNSAGQIETITKDGSDTIVSNMDYSPMGQNSLAEYGNGTTTTNTYDPSENYRLTNKVTTGTYEAPVDIDLYAQTVTFDSSKTALNYTLGNTGTTDVSSSEGGYNQIYLDGVKIQDRRWSWHSAKADLYLAGEGSASRLWRLYMNPEFASLTIGDTYDLEVCIDDTSIISETDETNNCESVSFIYTGDLPDPSATITNLDTSTYTLSYDLANEGTVTTLSYYEDTSNIIYLDGVAIDETTWGTETDKAFTKAGLSVSKDYTLNTSSLVDGTIYELEVCTDTGNIIAAELDETNNCDSTTFAYTAPIPSIISPLAFNFLDWLIPSAHAATGNIQDLTYTYDNNGNITNISDASITPTYKTLDYTYDDLNRLLSADSTDLAAGDYSLTYEYDSLGNMTSKSDIGTMDYSGTGFPTPHAVINAAGDSYEYDDNGNLISDGEHTYSWTIRNELDSSDSSSFTYDHSGQRITSNSGTETVYVNSLMQIRDGVPTYYIFAGSQRVAAYEDGTLTYYHQDHLGGTALISDETDLVVQVNDYYPYGSELLSEKTGDSDAAHTFTDKEYDDELGLFYFEARWMNPAIGSFVSLDPAQYDERVFQMIQDPQSFNAYAYARNNPIVMVDPDGEFAFLLPFLAPVAMPAVSGTAIAAYTAVIAAGIYIGTYADDALEAVVNVASDYDIYVDGIKDWANEVGNTPDIENTYGDTEWYGSGDPASGNGNYFDPDTGLRIHPDLKHGDPKGPHYGVYGNDKELVIDIDPGGNTIDEYGDVTDEYQGDEGSQEN
jgi:RHS repeat-associated protein